MKGSTFNNPDVAFNTDKKFISEIFNKKWRTRTRIFTYSFAHIINTHTQRAD